MALDEPKDTDTTIWLMGIRVIMAPSDEDYLRTGGGVVIDHRENRWTGPGFSVTQRHASRC